MDWIAIVTFIPRFIIDVVVASIEPWYMKAGLVIAGYVIIYEFISGWWSGWKIDD